MKEEEEQERVNQEKAAEEAGEDGDGQDSSQGPWKKSGKTRHVAPVAPKPGRHRIVLTLGTRDDGNDIMFANMIGYKQGFL